jgi:uncharacterized protein YjdB
MKSFPRAAGAPPRSRGPLPGRPRILLVPAVVLSAAGLSLLASCDSTEPVVPTTLQLSQTSAALQYGQTVTVRATILDQKGAPIDPPPEGLAITWTSANQGIASVDAGTILGTGAGNTTVTARAGGLQAQVQVTVSNAPTSIRVDPQSLTLEPGLSATLVAVVLNEQGTAMTPVPTGFAVSWSSADPAVATVSGGAVTAVAEGQTTVRAEAGALPPATVAVQVARVPGSVVLSVSHVELEVGESVTVAATIRDRQGQPYATPPAGHAVSWSTSAGSVATVEDGVITATGAGEATVTARAGDLPATTVHVVVSRPPVSAQLAFSYSGHRSGSFAVSTSFHPESIPWDDSWAFTTYGYDGSNYQEVLAQSSRADGRYDIFWLVFEDPVTTTGTRVPLAGFFIFRYNPTNDTADAIYLLESGSVVVTSASPSHLAGTFTLRMLPLGIGPALNVTNGNFDLPNLPPDDLFAAPAAFGGAGGRWRLPTMLESMARDVRGR